MALKKTTDTEETAEKKTAVKKTAAKKATATEKTTAKKAAADEKTAAKKTGTARKSILAKKTADETEPAAKKTTTRKTAAKKKEPSISVVIEYAGKQLNTDDVIASVTGAYMKANPDTAIETVEIYIQPEKNVAYYVVNGETGKNTRVSI